MPRARGFPGGSDGKASAHNVEDQGSIPGLGRSPGEGIAWKIPWTESWTQLSNLTSLQGKGQDYRLQILVLLFMLCDPGQLN